MEINKNSIQELANRIVKENDLFLLSTPNEKKVIVAEDCLIRIQAQQLIPYCGIFINNPKELQQIPQSIQAQINTPEVGIQCESCAKGSLFLSYVGRANKFDGSELVPTNDIFDAQHKKLLEIFSIRELAYIEFAFEGQQYINYEDPKSFYEEDKKPILFTEEEQKKAILFYIEYGGQYKDQYSSEINYDNFQSIFDENNEDFFEETNGRLIAICENIIKNNGEFIL